MKLARRKIIDISILVAYIGLVYSTLSVTQVIYSRLNKAFGAPFRNTMDLIIVVFTLGATSLFYRRLKSKKAITYLAFITIFIIYALLVTYLVPVSIEKIHLLEYGFLGYLALRVFRDVRSRDARYIYVTLIIVVVGYFDEFIQGFLPNRVYDLRDVYLNILSGLLGLALIRLLR